MRLLAAILDAPNYLFIGQIRKKYNEAIDDKLSGKYFSIPTSN
jgi:hypothetical protein